MRIAMAAPHAVWGLEPSFLGLALSMWRLDTNAGKVLLMGGDGGAGEGEGCGQFTERC